MDLFPFSNVWLTDINCKIWIMRHFCIALMMASLPVAVLAARPMVFQATSAEKASGFASIAECEVALGVAGPDVGGVRALRGSTFNRAFGNMSRCEMVAGEPVIVVYPANHSLRAPVSDMNRQVADRFESSGMDQSVP